MEKHALTAANTQTLLDITQNTIYLMGGSFIIGSMFTLFLLLILDWVRSSKTEGK